MRDYWAPLFCRLRLNIFDTGLPFRLLDDFNRRGHKQTTIHTRGLDEACTVPSRLQECRRTTGATSVASAHTPQSHSGDCGVLNWTRTISTQPGFVSCSTRTGMLIWLILHTAIIPFYTSWEGQCLPGGSLRRKNTLNSPTGSHLREGFMQLRLFGNYVSLLKEELPHSRRGSGLALTTGSSQRFNTPAFVFDSAELEEASDDNGRDDLPTNTMYGFCCWICQA